MITIRYSCSVENEKAYIDIPLEISLSEMSSLYVVSLFSKPVALLEVT